MGKMRYGLPYKGSKNKIARDIIEFLPAGECLVDLFGGGGAISHAALLSGKWDRVIYNDAEPGMAGFFLNALKGDYRNVRQEWVSREEFFARRETDPYVKYMWSFGNNGRDYMYSTDIEEYKR